MPQSPIIKGTTTIKWGSGSYLGTGLPTTAVVESMRITPVTFDAEIEGNDGFTTTEVLGDNGFDAEITCLYDSALTWPAFGVAVTLKRPTDSTGKLCLVVSTDEQDVARKREAKITMKLKYRPDRSTA